MANKSKEQGKERKVPDYSATKGTSGSNSPLGRAGEPSERAECYVFLASADASYMTGQVLHPNGGEIING